MSDITMSVPAWQYAEPTKTVVIRQWPDGNQESAVVTREDVAAWLATGNVPLPFPLPEAE